MSTRLTAWRTAVTAAAAVATAFTGFLAAPPHAAAVPSAHGTARAAEIESRITTFAGKCLDVEGFNSGDKVPIIQFRCNGQANQRFTLVRAGGGQYEIRTFAGKCLDVEGFNSGDKVPIIQFRCNGQANQRFRIAV